MQLTCPNCQAEILAADINIQQLAAICSRCNHVFNFQQDIEQAPRVRPDIPMPAGIEAFSFLSELNLLIKWRQLGGLGFFLFFTIFWNALVFPFALIAIMTGNFEILFFISLHLSVGIGLLYYTVAKLINTTYITLTRRKLTIEHKPIPWIFSPNKNIDTADITQLFVERYVPSRTNGQPDYRFRLVAIRKQKDRLPLMQGLTSAEQARYIEQEMERFLQLPDRPVQEEWT
ncbi:MAG: hypothetical protein IPN33_19590 [Saprospiraceae bacterium]|nr:hypothetical protein [Saprospiraceae bacterium]